MKALKGSVEPLKLLISNLLYFPTPLCKKDRPWRSFLLFVLIGDGEARGYTRLSHLTSLFVRSPC